MGKCSSKATPGRRAREFDDDGRSASSNSAVHRNGGAPAIRVLNLWKRYGTVEAVRGIDLEVDEGEIFGLIGPDGAGKTSTFQVLAGVMEPSSGEARFSDSLHAKHAHKRAI